MAKQILARVLVLASCACSNGNAAGKPALSASPAPALTSEPLGRATAATKYVFSAAGSRIALAVSDGGKTHTASFGQFEGAVELVEGDLQKSLILLTLATTSLSTDDPKLGAQLKGAELLDVAAFPEASFRSTTIVAGGAAGATHTVTGRLHLRGVSQPISFPANLKVAADTLQIEGEFALDPKAFGMLWRGHPDRPDAAQALRLSLKLALRGVNASK